MSEFCPEGHRHDALCDPALREPRVAPSKDPVEAAHKRHMLMSNQSGWLAWQLTRPLKGGGIRRDEKGRFARR